ncbi:hypothetical protein LguiA_024827 [Lonicera macranthoides]
MKNTLVESVGPFGGAGGGLWDDGIYSTIRQIVIYTSSCTSVIEGIQMEYDDEGESKWSEMHGPTKCAKKNTVELKYPDEYLCSVIGHYDKKDQYVVIQSLSFVSNKTKYGPFGAEKGTYFKFPSTSGNNKIIGFHGRSAAYLDSIGGYIEPIPDTKSISKSLGPFGGTVGGYRWDDGSYTTIRKLIVYSSGVIEAIQIEYDDNEQPRWSNTYGSKSGKRDTVELDYPHEYLVSVSGYIHVESAQTVVYSLKFESSRRTYGPFGTEKGTQFKFPSTGSGKIVGFHGRCGVRLYSIGGYYKPNTDPNPWTCVGPLGRQGLSSYDDGVHTTVRQLIITSSEVIESIQIEYDDLGKSKWSSIHGRKQGTINKVELEYPGEYLLSVSGYAGKYYDLEVIKSLTVETNRRTYGPFGTPEGDYFKLPPVNCHKIIGFHGNSGYHLDSIGAYLDTCSDPSKWTSVGPHGRQGGCSWDDGVHTTVRRLIIHSLEVIEGIQIEYDVNGQSKLSDIHGREKGTRRTVELDYPNEFLISVSGYIVDFFDLVVIHSLTFESNRRTYGPFGNEKGLFFKIPSNSGKKIIGFNGSSSYHLNSIGAYFEPSS